MYLVVPSGMPQVLRTDMQSKEDFPNGMAQLQGHSYKNSPGTSKEIEEI